MKKASQLQGFATKCSGEGGHTSTCWPSPARVEASAVEVRRPDSRS